MNFPEAIRSALPPARPAQDPIQPVQADQEAPKLLDLLSIAFDAIQFTPPLYISSIFGHPRSWIPPFHRYSEYRIINIWRPGRTLKYFVDSSFPSIPRTPPPYGPPLLNDLFWQPTVVLQRPDHNGSYTSFPEEAWFYINGIMTNDSVAQINAAYLAYLFHRPVTLIQNSTDSLPVDLLHCIVGKSFDRQTEEAIKAFTPIYDALKSGKKRVVVIAHSQGTIILANVLRFLEAIPGGISTEEALQPFALAGAGILAGEGVYEGPMFVFPDEDELRLSDFDPLTEAEWSRLEIYNFANCANVMKYHRAPSPYQPPTPWIENFGNQFDLVARLGMLAPNPVERGIDLDGFSYMQPGAWGHLLNEHYLKNIEKHQKSGRKRGSRSTPAPYEPLNNHLPEEHPWPRLFDYINGGQPESA